MIKLSVIVPCYNAEKFVKRCADSLLAQTLRGMELIFVDDASVDGTPEILRGYNERCPDFVKVIRLNENLRAGGARNAGMRAADGEYVGFADADDWAEPSMYEKLYNAAVTNGAEIAGCDFNRTLTRDGVTASKPFSLDLGGITGNSMEKDKNGFLCGMWSRGGYPVTKVYKKKMLIENSLWFPERTRYEDLAWNPLPLMYAEKYVHVPEPLYNYSVNPESATLERNSPHHFERLKTLELFLSECRMRGLYEKYREFVEYYFIGHYYANTVYIAFSRFDEPDFKKINEIKTYIGDNFPDYRNRPCWQRFTENERMLMELTDKDPNEAYGFYLENA